MNKIYAAAFLVLSSAFTAGAECPSITVQSGDLGIKITDQSFTLALSANSEKLFVTAETSSGIASSLSSQFKDGEYSRGGYGILNRDIDDDLFLRCSESVNPYRGDAAFFGYFRRSIQEIAVYLVIPRTNSVVTGKLDQNGTWSTQCEDVAGKAFDVFRWGDDFMIKNNFQDLVFTETELLANNACFPELISEDRIISSEPIDTLEPYDSQRCQEILAHSCLEGGLWSDSVLVYDVTGNQKGNTGTIRQFLGRQRRVLSRGLKNSLSVTAVKQVAKNLQGRLSSSHVSNNEKSALAVLRNRIKKILHAEGEKRGRMMRKLIKDLD